MGLLITAAVLLFGFGTAYVASDEVRYLSRAGIEETRILVSRVPISELAKNTQVPDSLREMAGLVMEVRNYARALGLDAKETYTTYADVGRDTLLLVLTASPKDCLCPVTWRYPVAGRVPYKGFFDFAAARKAAKEFADQGYDVYLRPSAAFSTLGWFNDPLLSTALSRDSVELASLVFHEIAHTSLWVKGNTAFNESFAQWVGYAAAQRFFLSRADTLSAIRAADRWHDEQALGEYYTVLLAKLDSLYARKLPREANDSGRAAVAQWARDTMAGPFGGSFRTFAVNRLAERPINNAALLGTRLYRSDLHLFDDWLESQGGDLTRAVLGLERLLGDAEGDQAFQRLKRLIQAQRGARAPVPPLLPDSTTVLPPPSAAPR
ncbi:MAG: aminopeptidase [Gemmatimonadetes bacterium]|nr:aminopeptidase [Gemmatimonadota bacterium]